MRLTGSTGNCFLSFTFNAKSRTVQFDGRNSPSAAIYARDVY